jgi:hypothetical protein
MREAFLIVIPLLPFLGVRPLCATHMPERGEREARHDA